MVSRVSLDGSDHSLSRRVERIDADFDSDWAGHGGRRLYDDYKAVNGYETLYCACMVRQQRLEWTGELEIDRCLRHE